MTGPFIEPDDPAFKDPPDPEIPDDKNECIAPSPILPNEECVGDLVQAYAELIGDSDKATQIIKDASMQALVNFAGVDGDIESNFEQFVEQIRETDELSKAQGDVTEFTDAAEDIVSIISGENIECPEDLIALDGLVNAATRLEETIKDRLPFCNLGRSKQKVLDAALESLSIANIASSALGITGNEFCALVREEAEILKSSNVADLVDPDAPGPTPPTNVFVLGNMDRIFIIGWDFSEDPLTLGYVIRVGKTMIYLATKEENLLVVRGIQNNTELDVTVSSFNEIGKEGDVTEAINIIPAGKSSPPVPVINSVLPACEGVTVSVEPLERLTESVSELFQTATEVFDIDKFELKMLESPQSSGKIIIRVTEAENVTRGDFYDLDNSALTEGGLIFELDNRPDTTSGQNNLAIGMAETDEIVVTYEFTEDPRRTARVRSAENFEFAMDDPSIDSFNPVTEILKVVNKSRQSQSYDVTGTTLDPQGNLFKLVGNRTNQNIGLRQGDEIEVFYIREIPNDYRGLFLRYRELGSSDDFTGPFQVSDGQFPDFTFKGLQNGITYEFKLTAVDNDVPPNESEAAVFAETPSSMVIVFEKFVTQVTVSSPVFGEEITVDGQEYGIGDIIPINTQLITEFSLNRDNTTEFLPRAWMRKPDFELVPLAVERINDRYFRVIPERIRRFLAYRFRFRTFGIRTGGSFGFGLGSFYFSHFDSTIPIREIEEDEDISDLLNNRFLTVIETREKILLNQIGSGQEAAVIVRSFGDNGDWDESSFPFFVESSTLPAVTITSVSPEEIPVSVDPDLLEFINIEVIGDEFVSGMDIESSTGEIRDLIVVNKENASFRVASTVVGPMDIKIINVDGNEYDFPGLFTVVDADPPTVEAVTPSKTEVGITVDAAIRGTRFRIGAIVLFGDEQAESIAIESDTLISCTVPDTVAGKVDVKVINPDGKEGVLVDGFIAEFPFAPETLDVVPRNSSVLGGEVIAVVGANFVDGAEVFIDDNPSPTVLFVNENQLDAVVPPADVIVADPGYITGLVDVQVVNTDDQESTLSDLFEYVLCGPEIITVSPSEVITDGGETVTLLGNCFFQGLTIVIETDAGDITVPSGDITLIDSSQVDFIMPASLTIETPEIVTIKLTNTDSQFTTAPIKYVLCIPSITGIAPPSGVKAGGYLVTLTGDCFFTGCTVAVTKSAITVPITIFTIVDRNTITIPSFPASPDGSTGISSVKVTNIEGNSDSISFTYT